MSVVNYWICLVLRFYNMNFFVFYTQMKTAIHWTRLGVRMALQMGSLSTENSMAVDGQYFNLGTLLLGFDSPTLNHILVGAVPISKDPIFGNATKQKSELPCLVANLTQVWCPSLKFALTYSWDIKLHVHHNFFGVKFNTLLCTSKLLLIGSC